MTKVSHVYPEQIKKEAKKLEKKIKRSDYKFLDQVVLNLEMDEFPLEDVTIM